MPPATGIEIEFHDRWIDRRIHELLTSGNAKTEQEAKAMAAAEFVKQYPYIHLPGRKAQVTAPPLRLAEISRPSKTSVALRGTRGKSPLVP